VINFRAILMIIYHLFEQKSGFCYSLIVLILLGLTQWVSESTYPSVPGAVPRHPGPGLGHGAQHGWSAAGAPLPAQDPQQPTGPAQERAQRGRPQDGRDLVAPAGGGPL